MWVVCIGVGVAGLDSFFFGCFWIGRMKITIRGTYVLRASNLCLAAFLRITRAASMAWCMARPAEDTWINDKSSHHAPRIDKVRSFFPLSLCCILHFILQTVGYSPLPRSQVLRLLTLLALFGLSLKSATRTCELKLRFAQRSSATRTSRPDFVFGWS